MPDEETWRAYYEEAAVFTGYLPDPDELQARVLLLDELQALDLHPKLIDSVMRHGTPTIERVRRMVARYGPKETWRRCRHFVEEGVD